MKRIPKQIVIYTKSRLLLLISGIVCLGLGVLYYITLRDPAPILLQYIHLLDYGLLHELNNSSQQLVNPDYFNWLNSLPSFLHVVSFTLITLAVMKSPVDRWYLVPFTWWAVNIIFELGQGTVKFFEIGISSYNSTYYKFVIAYFVNGTFSIGDILSASIGALLALLIVRRISAVTIFGTKSKSIRYYNYAQPLVLAMVFVGGLLSITGTSECIDEEDRPCTANADPIYMSYEDLRGTQIHTIQDHPISSTGKIYVYLNYLLVNSPNEGIHIFDNTDPASPQLITFINIPGNLDIAIRSEQLYVDSYIDLVVIDISDINTIHETRRVTNVFPYDTYQNIPAGISVGLIDASKGVVVGYTLK